MTVSLEKIVSVCKQRGFIFSGSEIYGGLANTWDYGPLGVQMKKNIKDLWWSEFVVKRQDMVGLDAAILMNPKTWVASGHVGSFSDPLMDCKKCKVRERADKMIEEWKEETGSNDVPHNWAGEKTPAKDLLDFVQQKNIRCKKCESCNWSEPKSFNLMFKTEQGVVEGEGKDIYLRPETAQGIFVNFKNVLNTTRKKLPFGIAQIGKSFRNEITPGNFIFRTREFEQMEIEYFVEPGTEKDYLEQWKKDVEQWFHTYGINPEHLMFRAHAADELSHYSNGTYDVEYKFPWGWGELTGIASRTDYDLKAHEEHSGVDLKYTDPYDNTRKFHPYVIEPSFGCDRTLLVFLFDAYHEETLEDGSVRVVMRFHKKIAPIKAAVLPLKKNNDDIVRLAREITATLTNYGIVTQYDDTGAIGKLYRRQDEIGTPYCITVDFDSIEDNTVTLRDRDTMTQERMLIEDLIIKLREEF